MNLFNLPERIPGPPRNIRFELEKDNSIKVLWDPPIKNPEKVELYRYNENILILPCITLIFITGFRVFWRLQGFKQAEKNDTKRNWLTIAGLKENVPYELVVKAGNRDGTSTLTEPLIFTLSDKYIISASTHSGSAFSTFFKDFSLS